MLKTLGSFHIRNSTLSSRLGYANTWPRNHERTARANCKLPRDEGKLSEVVIVTGTPGTGKTTFSKRLAGKLGADYISLAEYVSKHRLFLGFDRERRSKIIAVAKTRASLNNMVSHTRGPLVIDTHVADGILPKKTVRQVFVLRCHPRILEARLVAKGWKAAKVRENVLAEVLDSCLILAVKYYGWRKVAQLDTSRAGVGRCIALAKRALGRKPPIGRIAVDWLTKLEKEGSLERCLK